MKRSVTQIMAARPNDVLLELATSLQTMTEGILPVNPEQAEELRHAMLLVLEAAHVMRTIALSENEACGA